MSSDILQLLSERGLETINRYYGIHRAIVQEATDPENLNRLLVWLPDIPNAPKVWALPKGSHGSVQNGFKYLTPQPGDFVYVTFEYGDISKALWEYHGWGVGETPPQLIGPNTGGFVTPRGNRIVFREDDDTLEISFQGNINITSSEGTVVLSGEYINLLSRSGIIFNKGENDGTVNVLDLTNRLNQLVQELEQLKVELSTHTHTGVTTGPGASGPPAVPLTTVFQPFQETDYQDTSIIH